MHLEIRDWRLGSKKWIWLTLAALLLVACGGAAGDPAGAVERYLQAIVSTDQIGAVNAACAADELTAMLESAAYEGVDSQLENLDCQVVSQDGDGAQVSCDGQVRYSYAGGEDQLDELGGRSFTTIVEGGEWRVCAAAAGEAAASETTPTATSGEVAQAEPSPEPPTATPTPAASPTPDTRPLPEAWRSWPIIPTLSPWLLDVYQAGIAQGNDPHHFAKAGDCQNIPEAFMGLYDTPGRYTPPSDEAYLQDTIDYYAGSWGRDGLAVDGGFNFPAIFTPLRADPAQCEDDETPLACEIRVYQPSFIFISMEFVYDGRTADNYEDYLRQAVDYALAHNVIPILLTKADNVEGDNSINLATVQVAYDYDVPLVNWWRAAQPLAGHGIDWARDAGKRPEGFHITYEAWGVRSYLGLKTMDAMRKTVAEQ